MEMLLFDIAGERYGVDLMDVDEVLHMSTLRTIPSAPGFLAGVLNLRGALVPVVDIQERLGHFRPSPPPQISATEAVQSSYPKGTRLLLTGRETFRYGVVMDGWQGIRQFDEQSYRDGILTTESKSPFINGMNLADEGMIQRILLRRLLQDVELEMLQTEVGR
ncbi:MAG: chemotaxis protein CheW [Gammaproteobacteria bacterium]|jgi:purine-binding chemotaxis protein CheW|nr:chemotaxis protein CheW [Gammaproteobacteria bacterium]MBT7306881.1 chemotaxis protein CheW [Gammaproteobacteria bacterium]